MNKGRATEGAVANRRRERSAHGMRFIGVNSTLRESSSEQLPSLASADLDEVRSSDGGSCCSARRIHAEGSAREAGQASSRQRQMAPETRPD